MQPIGPQYYSASAPGKRVRLGESQHFPERMMRVIHRRSFQVNGNDFAVAILR